MFTYVLLSNLFHFDAWNHDVLFLTIDVLDLLLEDKTSDVQITLRNEVSHLARIKEKKISPHAPPTGGVSTYLSISIDLPSIA